MTPITHDRISVRTKLQHKMHLPITSPSLIWSPYSNPAKTPIYEARYSMCIFFQLHTKHSLQSPKHTVTVQEPLLLSYYRQWVPTKHHYISIRLHNVTTQNTVFFAVTTQYLNISLLYFSLLNFSPYILKNFFHAYGGLKLRCNINTSLTFSTSVDLAFNSLSLVRIWSRCWSIRFLNLCNTATSTSGLVAWATTTANKLFKLTVMDKIQHISHITSFVLICDVMHYTFY